MLTRSFGKRPTKRPSACWKKTSGLFPPRQSHPQLKWENKGRQKTSHLTVNGRLEVSRTIFWNKDIGAVVPMDILLGIGSSSHSLGVREICCRESLNNAFVPASKNIKRLAQLDISLSVERRKPLSVKGKNAKALLKHHVRVKEAMAPTRSSR